MARNPIWLLLVFFVRLPALVLGELILLGFVLPISIAVYIGRIPLGTLFFPVVALKSLFLDEPDEIASYFPKILDPSSTFEPFLEFQRDLLKWYVPNGT